MKREPLPLPTGAPTTTGNTPGVSLNVQQDLVSLVLMPNLQRPEGGTEPISYDEYQSSSRSCYPDTTPVLFTVVKTDQNVEFLMRLGEALQTANVLGGLVVTVGDHDHRQRVYGETFRPDEQGNACTTNGMISWGSLQVHERETQTDPYGEVMLMMGSCYFTEYDPDFGVGAYHN
jgi:hypothetical protein